MPAVLAPVASFFAIFSISAISMVVVMVLILIFTTAVRLASRLIRAAHSSTRTPTDCGTDHGTVLAARALSDRSAGRTADGRTQNRTGINSECTDTDAE